MISFKDADLTAVLPSNLTQIETQALGEAIKRGLIQVQKYSKTISLYGAIPELSDEVLNLLAIELRTQYYDPLASRKIREEMVRKTIAWYLRGGTGSVLTEYLAALYQGGRLEEWYSYGGKPYYFKAIVDLELDDEIPLGAGRQIVEKINAYKNVRSWLEALSFHIGVEIPVPVKYENQITFQTEFYPRYNLGYLYLDGKWKLDGTRKLNGYDSDDYLDFYPVGMQIQTDSSVSACTKLEAIEFKNDVSVGVECAGGVTQVNTAVRIQAEAEEQVSFGSAAALTIGSESSMINERYLDGKWKLDGSRKLDGGRYLL